MSNDIYFYPKKKTEAVKNIMNYVICNTLYIYMYISPAHAVFPISCVNHSLLFVSDWTNRLLSLTAAFESVGTMLTNMDTPQKEEEAKVSGGILYKDFNLSIRKFCELPSDNNYLSTNLFFLFEIINKGLVPYISHHELVYLSEVQNEIVMNKRWFTKSFWNCLYVSSMTPNNKK